MVEMARWINLFHIDNAATARNPKFDRISRNTFHEIKQKVNRPAWELKQSRSNEESGTSGLKINLACLINLYCACVCGSEKIFATQKTICHV